MCYKISCGEWNTEFSYIFLASIFNILNDCFKGSNNNEVFKTLKFFEDSKLSDHILIRYLFNYIFIALVGLGLFLYDCYIIKKEKSKNINYTNNIRLIHYNAEENMKTKKVFIISLLIYVIWFVEELCLDYFIVSLKDIDWWMFELLILAFLTLKIFNLKIYRHQRLAIYISFGSFALKIISIIVTYFDEKKFKTYEGGLPILYRIKPINFFGFFLYLSFIFFRSSVNLGLKWLMEKKYIPINKILISHGIIGIFCSLICISFSTFIPCNYKNINDFNNIYNYSNYICKVNVNDTENRKKEYLDNILAYVNQIDWEENWGWGWEILTIFSWQITFFFFLFFSLLVIKFLSPGHYIFSIPMTFFFQKLLNASYTMIRKKTFFKENTDIFRITKFFLDILGDVIAIIGLLIYLEIIVLNFKNLDFNIKVNIIKRSKRDTLGGVDESISFNIDRDNTIDEED